MWDDDCYESQDFAVLLGLDAKLIIHLNGAFFCRALRFGAREYFKYNLELIVHLLKMPCSY